MTNPAIQNDFSYYRRTLNRMRINNVPVSICRKKRSPPSTYILHCVQIPFMSSYSTILLIQILIASLCMCLYISAAFTTYPSHTYNQNTSLGTAGTEKRQIRTDKFEVLALRSALGTDTFMHLKHALLRQFSLGT